MERTTLQKMAMLFGVVFLLITVLGFIPGVIEESENGGDLFTFGDTGALLLGIFGVNVVENIIHLLFGIAGLALARTHAGARSYFLGGGVIYILVGVLYLIVGHDTALNFIGVNTESDYLHLVLGVLMLLFGFALGRATTVTTRTSTG